MKGLLSIIAGFVSKPAFDAAEKAAKQGNPFEQFNLGLMYYKGRGTAQDYTKAVYWWRRAAVFPNGTRDHWRSGLLNPGFVAGCSRALRVFRHAGRVGS